MASVGGLLGGVAWGRLQGRICCVLGLRRSVLVRLLRTVDAATGGRTFGGWYVRLFLYGLRATVNVHVVRQVRPGHGAGSEVRYKLRFRVF